MSWTPYRLIDVWVEGFYIYCRCNDGTWRLDIRDYSQASHPEVKYLIDNPDVLANVGFDEDGFPEWPNGFAPDTDIFRDEGEKVSVVSPKVASKLSNKVTAALKKSGVPIRTNKGVTEVLMNPATERPVREQVKKVLEGP